MTTSGGSAALPPASLRGFLAPTPERYHKDTLGADLRGGARRVLKLIVRANARRATDDDQRRLAPGMEPTVISSFRTRLT